MPEYTAPRGTKDVLPEETPKWQYLENMFRDICKLYGVQEIRTPTFEHTELFTRNLGESTDVVSKEMYTFKDRSDRSITLRPEGTAGAIRAYVQHNLGEKLPVCKVFYIANLFRYERPQSGRYREHTQMGIEVIGSSDPSIDAEVISLVVHFYNKIGLNDYTLKLNSIGCNECRPLYKEALKNYLSNKVEKMCDSCLNRYETNPLRILDCKNPDCKDLIAESPTLVEYLDDDCKKHFEDVQKYLNALNIEYILDPRLVRGFDYYTKTAFEFVSGTLGAQNAIGGGGRYDNLVQDIGGKPTPAIGFGLGLERLIMTLDSLNIQLPIDKSISVYIAPLGSPAREMCVNILKDMRLAGISADMDYIGKSLKAQMKTADKMGAKLAIIVGDDEVASNEVIIRDMYSSSQVKLSVNKIIEYIFKN
ncbi:MAG: histidine--tRNA ligase [Armatimonadota bacterium]